MSQITRSVGRGVFNPSKSEVALIQRLLNRHRQPPLAPIETEGKVGKNTIGAIEEFQRRVVKMAHRRASRSGRRHAPEIERGRSSRNTTGADVLAPAACSVLGPWILPIIPMRLW